MLCFQMDVDFNVVRDGDERDALVHSILFTVETIFPLMSPM